MALMIRSSVIALCFAISACGGGGGGGGGQTPISNEQVIPQTFQLKTAGANDINDTTSRPVTISGTVNVTISGTVTSVAVTGSGTLSQGAVTAATFEGTNGLSKTTSFSGTITANGQTAPLAPLSATEYYDSNYNPLGYTNATEYAVRTGSVNIPETVKVGDSGVAYVVNVYTSNAKTTLVGTKTYSYSVEQGPDNTAVVRLTTVKKNTSNVVTDTDTMLMRLTTTGTRMYVSETLVSSDGTLTFTY